MMRRTKRILGGESLPPRDVVREPSSYASVCRDVFLVSGPLALGMSGYATALVVDRLALAAHSESTLAASGPAVFTAMTLITFFTGSIYFFQPRLVAAREKSSPGDYSSLAVELGGAIFFGLAATALLLVCFPLAAMLSLHSNRPEEIAQEEAKYLRLMSIAGSLMIFNAIGASVFSALGKTATVMRVSLAGYLATAVCTVTLVLGYLGFPSLGISGSAIASIIGASFSLLLYVYAIPSGLRIALLGSASGAGSSLSAFRLDLKHAFEAAWVGANDSADELGNTLILWAIGMIGTAALAANNINILLNYISVIPLIGIGNGANVMVSRAAVTKSSVVAFRTVVSSVAISLGYSLLVFATLWIFSPYLLSRLGLQAYDAPIYPLSVDLSKLIVLYAIAFSISYPVSRSLQALGRQRTVVQTRMIVMFGGSVPAAFLIAVLSHGNPYSLYLVWISLSSFEAIIGIRLFYVFRTTLTTNWRETE